MNENSSTYVTMQLDTATGRLEIKLVGFSFDTLRRVMGEVSQTIAIPSVSSQLQSKSSESRNHSSNAGLTSYKRVPGPTKRRS